VYRSRWETVARFITVVLNYLKVPT